MENTVELKLFKICKGKQKTFSIKIDCDYTKHKYTTYSKYTNIFVIIATNNGVIIGIGSASIDNSNHPFSTISCYLHKDFRKKGIGANMLLELNKNIPVHAQLHCERYIIPYFKKYISCELVPYNLD